MIVLDASVLIAHLDADDALHGRADRLLIAAGAEELGASPITLAEVLVGPARAGQLDKGTAALSQIGVRNIMFDIDAPLRLAIMRAGTGLKLPDCCVLLAAEQSQAQVATLDERLKSTARAFGFSMLEAESA